MARRRNDDEPPDEMMPEAEPDAAEPVTIDPMAVLVRLTEALEALTARQAQSPDANMAGLMEKLSTALIRVSESNLEGSKLIADETRRAARPSNEIYHGKSVFNRRGDLVHEKKPLLRCLMFLPWVAEWESLTREEVELLNLLEAGSYVVKRIDRTKVSMSIKMTYKEDMVTPSTLIITHDTAFNNDNFRMMPPLADLLRDMLKQHDRDIARKAAAVLSDEEEEALIEAGELSVSM